MTTTEASSSTLNPIAQLEQVRRDLAALEQRARFLVRVARDPKHLYSDGRPHSWAEIGAALGTTRQAAQQRYGSDEPRPGQCYFEGRSGCAGTATLRRGRVPLCEPCDARASTLTRAPRRPL